jgi:hypothetical protein
VGSGKSVLMSLVISHLKQLSSSPEDAVIYAFGDWQDRKLQTAANLLGSLVRQLAESCRSTFHAIADTYRSHKDGRIPLSHDEQLELMKKVSPNFCRIFVVFDALDECGAENFDSGSSTMSLMEESLAAILGDTGIPTMSILLSSRFGPSDSSRDKSFRTLNVQAPQHDIAQYIETEVTQKKIGSPWANSQLPLLLQRNKTLLNRVIHNCTSKAGDM